MRRRYFANPTALQARVLGPRGVPGCERKSGGHDIHMHARRRSPHGSADADSPDGNRRCAAVSAQKYVACRPDRRTAPTIPSMHFDQTFLGDSVGRWEGDTLVIDVVGFNDLTWLGWPGWFHTNEMRVEERFTREGNTLRYEVTAHDLSVLIQPWEMDPILLDLNPGTATYLEDPPCLDFDAAHMVTRGAGLAGLGCARRRVLAAVSPARRRRPAQSAGARCTPGPRMTLRTVRVAAQSLRETRVAPRSEPDPAAR